MKRFMIAGTNSGCGKTTVACSVLAALKNKEKDVTAFKCGPDYIDPMFHRHAIGIASHNLDSFFCDENTIKAILREYSHEISVIEGVMGFYDGGNSSAYTISEITGTPVIIVIDCKGMSDSIGAVMSGFLNFRSNNIAGFIFNRLPEKLIPLAERLCAELDTGYFGCMPVNKYVFGSRHLGLITADEIADIRDRLAKLGELAEKYILLDKLSDLEAAELQNRLPIPAMTDIRPVIAVARDKAFCFNYAENIELLEKMGCRIKYFSPLSDAELPEADGLILCGGYPELYAKELSENLSMRSSVKRAILSGMPTIAECGGFMYLHSRLTDKNGNSFAMAEALDGIAFPTDHLQRFGYVTMTAKEDNLICSRNETIKTHEFHYWDSTSCGNGFSAVKPDGRNWECCHISGTMYAGFPHIYFYSDISAAQRFVKKCCEYGGKNGTYKENHTRKPN